MTFGEVDFCNFSMGWTCGTDFLNDLRGQKKFHVYGKRFAQIKKKKHIIKKEVGYWVDIRAHKLDNSIQFQPYFY